MTAPMPRLLATSLALLPLLAGSATAQNPVVREVPTYSIEQLLGTSSLGGISFSPDGERILFTSDRSGVPNAYVVPVAGGEPVQLTHSTDRAIFTVGYFPSDERFLFSSDDAGNELQHLYVQELDGTVRDLTPGDNVRAIAAGEPHDDSFFIAINDDDPRRMDIHQVSLDDYSRTLLLRNDRNMRVGAISHDRRYLGMVRLNSYLDIDLFLHDRDTGEYIDLSPADGDARQRPQAFSRDGRSLFYLTDYQSEFIYLARYDIATGEHTTLLQPEWDVQRVWLSPSGRWLIVLTDNDARTELRILDSVTLEPFPLPELPAGDIDGARFSPDERVLALSVSSGRSPADLRVLDIATGAVRTLVRTLNPEVDPQHLVEPEVVRFASYDGIEIPGLLYRPHAASAEAPVPAMIWIHGGPGLQSRVRYDPLIQYLVNHGYAVYAINNRGSAGYGRSFSALDDRKHGEADLGDVVASKAMLIGTGWIDGDRIGVMGPSYGGFLTMAALTFQPEEFAVGVNIFGVTNWIRTLEVRRSERPWLESGLEATYNELGNPATDRERLHRISPLFHADRITKPFMVLHGANDPRVLQVESDEIVAAARANGVPVEYLVFPDEGHSFVRKANQVRAWRGILEFLDEHLKHAGGHD